VIRSLTRRAFQRFVEQLIGFLAFPLINAGVWVGLIGIQTQLARLTPGTPEANFLKIFSLLLPWAVNGTSIMAAFWISRYIGIGYLAFIAWAVAAVIVLGILFIPACLVAAVVGGLVAMPLPPGQAEGVLALAAVGTFAGILGGGLIILLMVFAFVFGSVATIGESLSTPADSPSKD
jgi:hypothetical protein